MIRVKRYMRRYKKENRRPTWDVDMFTVLLLLFDDLHLLPPPQVFGFDSRFAIKRAQENRDWVCARCSIPLPRNKAAVPPPSNRAPRHA